MDVSQKKKQNGIAVTGSICTGKTFVSQILCDLGYTVFDADQLSRHAVQPGSAGLKKLVETFGTTILNPDESLNRSSLAKKIFSSKNDKSIVESILHPIIEELLAVEVEKLQDRLWFYEASLIFETNQQSEYKEVWVTYCSKEEQYRRIAERDGLSLDKIKKILDNQLPTSHKANLASFKINTDQTKEKLTALLKEKMSSLGL